MSTTTGATAGIGHESRYNSLVFRQLLRRFLDVCNAIAYAHSRGVLHRDLKPGNIMLGKYGETYVVDWGLAKVLQDGSRWTQQAMTASVSVVPHSGVVVAATQMGSAIGTPAYMSPEQAAGQHDGVGPASDVYSLGAILYCLLTGRSPIPSGTLPVMLKKVQAGDIVPPRKLP